MTRQRRHTIYLLIAVLVALTSTATTHAQVVKYSLQVGAWGDDASRGNRGVRVEILTHIYSAKVSDFDYFWVGDNLDDGAFIQFGYCYEPGYYCLKGEWLGGKFTCLGGSDKLGTTDARWQWQYWPNVLANDFYYEIGPANSAGQNGTWHTYSIVPNSANGWSFLLDGQQVASLAFQCKVSRDPAYFVAEKATNSSALGILGPVEFRNLAYLKEDGWHTVDSLSVIRACGARTDCSIDNPYGVSLEGPSYVAAGSGLEKRENGEFLWTSSYVTLDLRVHSGTQVRVTSVTGSQVLDRDALVKLPKGMFVQVSLLNHRAPTEGTLRVLGLEDEFQRWIGDANSSDTTVNMLMDGNKRLEAAWITDYTVPLELGSVLLLLVVVVVVVWFVVRRLSLGRNETHFVFSRTHVVSNNIGIDDAIGI